MPITYPPPGAQQDTIIEPMDPRFFTTPAAITANLAYLVKFRVQRATTATGLAFYIGTAAGNADVGIFTSTNGTNFTLLGSSGSTAASGSSTTQAINLTANVPLVPYTNYWAAIVGDNVSLTIARISGAGTLNLLNKTAIAKAGLFPLATFTTLASTGFVPYLAIVTTG